MRGTESRDQLPTGSIFPNRAASDLPPVPIQKGWHPKYVKTRVTGTNTSIA